MRVLPTMTTPRCGILITAAALCGFAFAQTGLTTIQDTLFKADGTRFNGTLTIRWNTFDSANIGTIVQQSRSVSVVNGNLQVSLAPNAAASAPANVYTVHYQSDGAHQFTETWTVPSSAQALTVSSVRTGTLSGSGQTTTDNQTPIVESAVVGLVADLGQRPTKGPGFGTGSVAFINQDGQVETVVGSVGDCVFVDGTAGPCGGPSPAFFDAEIPGGLVDGTNKTFTLANPPSGSSLTLFRNGLHMKAGFDYTVTDSTVQFTPTLPAPQPGDTLVASYRVDPLAGNIGNLQLGETQGHSVAMAQVLCSASGRGTSALSWTSLGACDIPASALHPGDRIEVRFNFTHTGTASAFDLQMNWGTATILARHGGKQDSAFAGQAEAAIGQNGVQVTVQSWGTVLTFLPGIVSVPGQSGIKVDLLGRLSTATSDSLTLANYTVLRYPGF